MKGWTTMQDEKQLNNAFLCYLIILVILVGYNVFDIASIFDIIYLFVVVSCFVKYLLIVKEKRK